MQDLLRVIHKDGERFGGSKGVEGGMGLKPRT